MLMGCDAPGDSVAALSVLPIFAKESTVNKKDKDNLIGIGGVIAVLFAIWIWSELDDSPDILSRRTNYEVRNNIGKPTQKVASVQHSDQKGILVTREQFGEKWPLAVDSGFVIL